jgi:hypothetical protein
MHTRNAQPCARYEMHRPNTSNDIMHKMLCIWRKWYRRSASVECEGIFDIARDSVRTASSDSRTETGSAVE